MTDTHTQNAPGQNAPAQQPEQHQPKSTTTGGGVSAQATQGAGPRVDKPTDAPQHGAPLPGAGSGAGGVLKTVPQEQPKGMKPNDLVQQPPKYNMTEEEAAEAKKEKEKAEKDQQQAEHKAEKEDKGKTHNAGGHAETQ